MAQGISLISGSPLIGSPIVFKVVPKPYAANRNLHRVIVRVYAGLSTALNDEQLSDEGDTTFDFSTPVETKLSGTSLSAQPALFDISSALQAVADKYEYAATPPERYPYIKFRIEAWDEWMIDGRSYPQQDMVLWPGVGGGGGGNLLPGASTGEGWVDEQGNAADYSQDEGFYISDAIISPIVNFDAQKDYTLSFVCDDRIELYLAPTTGAYLPLDFNVSDNVYSANIKNMRGNYKIVIRADDGGYCKNIKLILIGDINFYAYAFMGAWTDMERMNAMVDQQGVEYLDTLRMSRKPTSSPEVVFTGCEFIYPDEFQRSILDTDHMSDGVDPQFVNGAPTDGPRSLTYTPQVDGAATIGGHNIYAVPRPAETGYLLRFINGLGCMETLHVQSLVKREANITTVKHTVARQETLKKFSRIIVRKNNNRETWMLTSGPLDEAWASWYIHEFLMAERIWIGVNPKFLIPNSQLTWLPCHVVPEETTVLEDREKAQPLEVQFRLEMDINGSPL